MLQFRVWFQSLQAKKFMPRYSWNIAKVDIKHQSINQSINQKVLSDVWNYIDVFMFIIASNQYCNTAHYYCFMEYKWTFFFTWIIIVVYACILKHLLKVWFQDLSISLCTHLLLLNIFTCHMHLWLKFFCLFCIHGNEYHYLMHCNQFSRSILLTTLRHIQCNMGYMT